MKNLAESRYRPPPRLHLPFPPSGPLGRHSDGAERQTADRRGRHHVTLYSEQTGRAPLWMETQNVTADANGHYTALLGATQSGGLPAELFSSEQARWVGIQVQEQPRVLLVSAPYALKASDAETIGGLPPSAFVPALG